MSKEKALSLWSAVIINTNIILGSGIFINTTELAKRAGLLGGLCYAIIGVLLLPLILSFVKLLEWYPGGGFYSFCSTSIHPLVGFLNSWNYFFLKLSSATLSIHIFTILLQKTFPIFAPYSTLMIDCIILAILLGLNMLNVRTGSKIQGWMMVLKLFPILFVILSGLFLLQGNSIPIVTQWWSGIPSALPLVLHAMLGFEVACALSRNIENPQVNAPKAVLFSYLIVVILSVAYQTFFYQLLGADLAAQIDYRGAFPLLLGKFNMSFQLQNIMGHIIHLAIATSALSAAFGIIYANLWNLYTLAELKHLVASPLIMIRNRFNIPFMCVLAQGAIMLTYLLTLQGKTTTFQQLSALGATITYTLSIFGLMATLYKNKRSLFLPTLALVNCAILLAASIYTLWTTNTIFPLQLIVVILFSGTVIYTLANKTEINHTQIE